MAQKSSPNPSVSRQSECDENKITRKRTKRLDVFLANSLAELSVEEREKQLEELHGISNESNVKEDLASIKILLQEMEDQLQSIKVGTAYEAAESNDKAFVSDESFRLMFLRAEKYNVKPACNRLLQFFNFKQRLFGAEKLAKTITLDDLDEDDMACIKSGSSQVLPCKDNAGRSVLLTLPSLLIEKPVENYMRARFYILMSLLESQENQIRGLTCVWYAVDYDISAKIEGGFRGALYVLPYHQAGIHLCSNDPKTYELASSAIYKLATKARPRMRVHIGSHLECQNALETFGIPKSALPFNCPFKCNESALQYILENHLVWLEQRKTLDAAALEPCTSSSSQSSSHQTNGPPANTSSTKKQRRAKIPSALSTSIREGKKLTPMDVVFGRGRSFQNHIGNTNFRFLLDEKREAYDEATRAERHDIAVSLVKQIKDQGGRFLKQTASDSWETVPDSDSWETVPDKEARVKVTNAFRSQRKLDKKKAQGRVKG